MTPRLLPTPLRTLAACLLLGALTLLTGCGGYDGSSPAYDTSANLGNFPPDALTFLDAIESNDLRTADQIIEQFADLYTAHPDLLSNSDWTEVLNRLGLRFQFRAEQFVADGIPGFPRAADYYTVAAQIRPTDTLLAARSRLFSLWRSRPDSPTPLLLPGFDAPAAQRFAALKDFALSDTLHQRFAGTYLLPALFDRTTLDSITEASSDGPSADRALLATLGAKTAPFSTTVARFVNPAIDVPAFRLTELAPDSFRIEIYFLPQQRVEQDLAILFWVETSDSQLPTEHQPCFPYDFRPVHPSPSWTPGRVTGGLHHFTFHYPISAIQLGLYENRDGRLAYLSPADTTANRIRLPLSPESPSR